MTALEQPKVWWIGKQLRNLRVLQDLSAKDLAQRTGLHPSELNHIERGRRSVTTERLAVILDALSKATA